jgi:uncharacterized membrane protein
MRNLTATVILLSIFLTKPGYAEVMDKEPSLILNYLWGILGAALCFFAARFKPWILLLVAPLPILYFTALIYELLDQHVGKDILNEAGYFYVVSGYFLAFSILASIGAGLWLRKNATT